MSVTIDSLLENSDFYCASHFTDLSPFDELELDCNADIFYPTTTGQWTAEFYATSSADNSESEEISFNVSQYEYALDNSDFTGDYTGKTGFGTDGTVWRGNLFEIYNDQLLYSIKVRIHPSSTAGAVASGLIFEVDADLNESAPIFMYETDEINVMENGDGWVDFIFDEPMTLSSGSTYLACVQSTGDGLDTLFIGTSGTAGNFKSWVHNNNNPYVSFINS